MLHPIPFGTALFRELVENGSYKRVAGPNSAAELVGKEGGRGGRTDALDHLVGWDGRCGHGHEPTV